MKSIYKKILKHSENKIITYGILETLEENKTHYGIYVSEEVNGIVREEAIESIFPNKNMILNLIDRLCENAIDIIHFKDIVEDYLLDNDL